MRRVLLIAALAALALPASASGAANHPFLPAINGGYEDACGVALHGGLYVSDYYHDTVELPGGGKIAPEDPHGGPCKLALDSEGNLYAYNYHHDVLKYPSSELSAGAGALIDSKEEAGAEAPTGLALDPTTENLYVAHRTYIAKYEAPVHAGEIPTKIGLDSNAAYYGIAVSDFPGSGAQPATAEDLYVPDAKDNTVKVFDSAGTLVETMDGAATPQGGFKSAASNPRSTRRPRSPAPSPPCASRATRPSPSSTAPTPSST